MGIISKMQSIQYNFKSIPVVQDVNGLIDHILSKTQKKTPTVTHPGYKITRIRRFYMRKVKFVYSMINEKIEGIINNFPKLDDIHPFYSDLINILYDKDHYKMALGFIHNAKTICEKISNDYVKLMKYGDSLYRCKQLKIAALGRMITTLKKMKSSLNYLEQVRKHMLRIPNIDPNTKTILICGYPNVGKSSFMNKLTIANVEVQPYPFTTKSLFIGHMDYKHYRWQVIDTPGILDRPLEERNIIEMQAITALAHLDACIIYFVDISENCGYSIEQQMSLFSSIKPLFKNKPLVITLNKTDLKPYNNLIQEDKNLIETMAKENNTYLIQMSNHSGDGVSDVKSSACDILTEFRFANKKKTERALGDNVLDKIYVAQPTGRGERSRKAFIPDTVKAERQQEQEEENERLMNMTQQERNQMEEKKLRDGDVDKLERKIKHNRVKDMIEANGGIGVFSISDREHFMLEKPEWKDDIWPEFMDGKNVFDYVDPDILGKLEKLEAEEEEYYRSQENQMDQDDESSELSDDLLEAHEDVERNKKIIKKKHELAKNSQLPRKIRDLTQSEKFMQEVRSEKKDVFAEMKEKSARATKDRREALRQNLKKNSRKDEDEEEEYSDEESFEEEEQMDIDDDDNNVRRNKGKSKKVQMQQRKKLEEQRKVTVQRMKNKIQKSWSKKALVNESDRKIPSKLPVHLNTGKRGKGKTDRR